MQSIKLNTIKKHSTDKERSFTSERQPLLVICASYRLGLACLYNHHGLHFLTSQHVQVTADSRGVTENRKPQTGGTEILIFSFITDSTATKNKKQCVFVALAKHLMNQETDLYKNRSPIKMTT